MRNHVYCCAECSQVVKGVISPKTDGCNKQSFHRWVSVGIEGDEKYECEDCKALVQTAKVPTSYGCSANIFHDWKKL